MVRNRECENGPRGYAHDTGTYDVKNQLLSLSNYYFPYRAAGDCLSRDGPSFAPALSPPSRTGAKSAKTAGQRCEIGCERGAKTPKKAKEKVRNRRSEVRNGCEKWVRKRAESTVLRPKRDRRHRNMCSKLRHGHRLAGVALGCGHNLFFSGKSISDSGCSQANVTHVT